FRVEFGAGLIKMRGDRCWKELTCMNYHHETQPLPNPLSRFFHHMPESFHKFETFSNHLVQLVIVWGLFAPQPIASIAAILIILTQSYLIISGNYAWLNLLTLILAFSAFSDPVITQYTGLSLSETATSPLWLEILVVLLGLLVIYLSIDPIRNMISSHQRMNFSFNPYHLVNTYGAFGTVTKKRYEIILEGTTDQSIDDDTQWKPYEFKGKPGDPHRLPPQIAPYHLRLDWQMWFAAMSSYHAHPWFLRLVGKLLDNDQQTVKLLKENPFEDKAPTYIRALLYHYEYSSPVEKKETGRWWRRSFQKEYLNPVNRESLNRFGL
ncbi:MAG: lipase maturation factor family protein, partial [Balneolaceae bacterium]|nr:lipase maturation factor family protein [Balneolaceae bacterium]